MATLDLLTPILAGVFVWVFIVMLSSILIGFIFDVFFNDMRGNDND